MQMKPGWIPSFQFRSPLFPCPLLCRRSQLRRLFFISQITGPLNICSLLITSRSFDLVFCISSWSLLWFADPPFLFCSAITDPLSFHTPFFLVLVRRLWFLVFSLRSFFESVIACFPTAIFVSLRLHLFILLLFPSLTPFFAAYSSLSAFLIAGFLRHQIILVATLHRALLLVLSSG